ncbi:RNA-binding NOB1-like protein [Drosera capensis]
MELSAPPQTLPSPWTKILTQPAPQPPKPTPTLTPTSPLLVPNPNSTKAIAVAVVDANAIIQGGERLYSIADRFVSVPEVINEVRDPVARHRLACLPFEVETMEPYPDAVKKVISFARETGDLQTLADVDVKLIALTYTLEAQVRGTQHLREKPPPVSMLKVKRLPEKDLPGWGDNVPNLDEWEALEGAADNTINSSSRILPLKDLSLNPPADDKTSLQDGNVGNGTENISGLDENANQSSRTSKNYLRKQRVVNIEGKKMVASGIDASQGEYEDDAGDFQPAVSRSTHRRYLRRKARREMYEDSLKGDEPHDIDDESTEENQVTDGVAQEAENKEKGDDAAEISTILQQMRLEENSLMARDFCEELSASSAEGVTEIEALLVDDENNENKHDGEYDHLEAERHTSEMVDTSFADEDGVSSEQSWTINSLSESSVACITGDFAMQNVILQMGLRLVAPGGLQIRELHRWILKCHACLTVTPEIGRIFCPKCGNGGTLRKVAVTVGENGMVLAARRPRVSLRGTRFSLPLPQGGRDGVSKNPILREDQLPHKMLHPKMKKKTNLLDDDIFASASIFTHHTDKKAPHRPPVRAAMAMSNNLTRDEQPWATVNFTRFGGSMTIWVTPLQSLSSTISLHSPSTYNE